jgi:hypothetical protein
MSQHLHNADELDNNGGVVKVGVPAVGHVGKRLAAPVPPGQENTDMLVLLRELSAEMLDLQVVLGQIKSGETSLDAQSTYIIKTVADVKLLIAAIEPFSNDPDHSDTIRHIFDDWEQMAPNPILVAPAGGTIDASTLLKSLDLLNGLIDKIVFLCGSLTVPDRLAGWIKATQPGYYIPFHKVFEDEIPNQDARQRLLDYLAWAPKVIKDGYVDKDAGLVYRYSERCAERWLCVLYMLLAFGALTGVVIGACYIMVPGWPLGPADLTTVLFGWIALIVGVIAHIGIGTIKSKRERGDLPELFAPADVLKIINTRLGQILLKLFIAVIGLFGLVFASTIKNFSIFNAFLVGYSLDSFVEMFGSTLDAHATTQLTDLQKQLTS